MFKHFTSISTTLISLLCLEMKYSEPGSVVGSRGGATWRALIRYLIRVLIGPTIAKVDEIFHRKQTLLS